MEATAPTGVSGRDAEKGPGLRVQLTSATEEGWNRAPFGKITGVFGFQPSRQLWDAMWFAEEETPRPAFAESPAYHTLFRELRNYLNGEIPGRSFLVSGHRGAGKTSMVLRAIEDLYDAAADEDPFDEDPKNIIHDIADAAVATGKKTIGQNLFREPDRRKAIQKALSLAGDGDLVLLTGKGAEQQIARANGQYEKWDDRVVTKEELVKLENK